MILGIAIANHRTTRFRAAIIRDLLAFFANRVRFRWIRNGLVGRVLFNESFCFSAARGAYIKISGILNTRTTNLLGVFKKVKEICRERTWYDVFLDRVSTALAQFARCNGHCWFWVDFGVVVCCYLFWWIKMNENKSFYVATFFWFTILNQKIFPFTIQNMKFDSQFRINFRI